MQTLIFHIWIFDDKVVTIFLQTRRCNVKPQLLGQFPTEQALPVDLEMSCYIVPQLTNTIYVIVTILSIDRNANCLFHN